MKRIWNCVLTDIATMLSLAFLSVLFSIVGSVVALDWTWLARSGALVTVCGVVLSVRPIIRKGYKAWFESLRVIDYGSIVPTPAEIEESRQLDIDARAVWVGAMMALAGALLGAYGDLLGNFVSNCSSVEAAGTTMQISKCFYLGWVIFYVVSFLCASFCILGNKSLDECTGKNLFASGVFLFTVVFFNVVLYNHAFQTGLFIGSDNKTEEKFFDWVVLVTNIIPSAFIGSAFFEYFRQKSASK